MQNLYGFPQSSNATQQRPSTNRCQAVNANYQFLVPLRPHHGPNTHTHSSRAAEHKANAAADQRGARATALTFIETQTTRPAAG
jgi:hypothetical protein